MLEPGEFTGFPLAVVLRILRVLWWLAWDLCFETVGWAIGWPICRLASLGRFPRERYLEPGSAEGSTAFFVELIGLLALAALIAYLSGHGPI
ncbi:hypothetical protein [Ideonella sp. YS5]|uniref:hypothetical protein n=1 Tax=Ideonella sp. YS5 TaxID=3453714 RepID=UPI003EEB7118